MTISGTTLGEAWIRYMGCVLAQGSIQPDDREDIFEITPVMVFIQETSDQDPIVKRFGDEHVIEIYTKKMYSRDLIPELNSTYGDRIFDNQGINQFDWVVDRLAGKWWTKGASISLLKPNDPGPRIPCLTQLQFVIREGRLNLIATFRSQNVFRSYGNFIGLKSLQSMAAERLRVDCGTITSFCACPHIYQSDLAAARDIVREAGLTHSDVLQDS